MKKKITKEQWSYIGKLNYAKDWVKPFCTYTLVKSSDVTYRRQQKLITFVWVLIFVPIHILEFFYLLWDGGLKEFEIMKNLVDEDVLVKGSDSYKRADEVFNNGGHI